QRLKDLLHRLRALKVGRALEAQAELMVVPQAQGQAAGLLRAKCLDVRKGQRFDVGQWEEVRQYLAGPAVFGMDVLQNQPSFGQPDIDEGGEEGFRPHAEFAAPSARDPSARKSQQLLVAFQNRPQAFHDLRLFRASLRLLLGLTLRFFLGAAFSGVYHWILRS